MLIAVPFPAGLEREPDSLSAVMKVKVMRGEAGFNGRDLFGLRIVHLDLTAALFNRQCGDALSRMLNPCHPGNPRSKLSPVPQFNPANPASLLDFN